MADSGYYSSSAWLLIGLHGSRSGTLTLAQGRLSYTDDEQKCVFDVAASEVADVDFPWYYFGGGVNLRVGAEKFRLSFVRPHDESGMVEGLEVARTWKPLLLGLK